MLFTIIKEQNHSIEKNSCCTNSTDYRSLTRARPRHVAHSYIFKINMLCLNKILLQHLFLQMYSWVTVDRADKFLYNTDLTWTFKLTENFFKR